MEATDEKGHLPSALGSRLYAARQAMDMSVGDVASELDLSEEEYMSLERGEFVMPADAVLEDVAGALGVPVEEMQALVEADRKVGDLLDEMEEIIAEGEEKAEEETEEEGEEDEPPEKKTAVGEMRSMSFETKQYEIKEDSDSEFEFTAYGAVFGNKDRGGDILKKGAFKRTIDHNDSRFPLVADHELKMGSRLGVAYAKEDDHGVRVNGHINTDTQMGREVASHIRHAEKHDLPIGMSFGYEVVKDGYDEQKNARVLKEIKNHEFTVTQIPMNEEAHVMGVKGILEDDDALEQLATKLKSLLSQDSDFQSTLADALDENADDSLQENPAEDSDADVASSLAEEAKTLASELQS